MPDPWVPGLIRDPGRSAGGSKMLKMQWCKHHDTAGTNSYHVCKWGRPGYRTSLCQILLPKEGVPWQFCEIDAVCSDSGIWNQWGPGIEVERLGHHELLTPDQVFWLGHINTWLEGEWSIPNMQYRGAQFGATEFHGHVNHSDIASNPDGLTYAEWNQVVTSPVRPQERDDLMLYKTIDNGVVQYYVKAKGLMKIDGGTAYAHAIAGVPIVDLGGGLGALAFDKNLRADYAKG